MPPIPLPLVPTEPATKEFLGTIQGNILNPHGRDHGRLIFFRFTGAGRQLRSIFPAAVAAELVTTAGQQWDAARRAERSLAAKMAENPSDEPEVYGTEPFFGVGFSRLGLEACGYQRGEMPGRGDRTFNQSMRDTAAELGDPQLGGGPDWEPDYLNEIHGVWLVAHDDPAQLPGLEARVTTFLHGHGATKIFSDDGLRWKDRAAPDRVREPFGFVDGISQPEFFKGPEFVAMSKWTAMPVEQVLMARGDGHDGGSFLVLRKLEQDVKGFRAFEKEVRSDRAWPNPSPYEPGAVLVGRGRDGTPLQGSAAPGQNDFAFDGDTTRCPFHAHIRKSNPRITGGPPPNPVSPNTAQDDQAQLIVRRSMVYDRDGKLPVRAEPNYPEGENIGVDGGVGLLFLAYMSSLHQFTSLQSWFSDPAIPRLADPATNLGDPLLRPDAVARSWEWLGVKRTLASCVRPRGGEYFYVPSVTWLMAQQP